MPYTQLRYHIVIATKHRKRLITPEVEAILYPAINDSVFRGGGHLIELGGDLDHAHVLTAIKPSISCSKFVGGIKCNSSRIVRETLPSLDFRWQKGFSAFTVSPFDHDELVAYIQNQKEHHNRGTLREQWETIWHPS